jgi:DNA polymerase II large subunit
MNTTRVNKERANEYTKKESKVGLSHRASVYKTLNKSKETLSVQNSQRSSQRKNRKNKVANTMRIDLHESNSYFDPKNQQ